MDLSPTLTAAREAGRLGLIVYTIPGFPSAAAYDDVTRWLEQQEFVSIIETTIPVTQGYSDHANATIRAAHAIGARESKHATVYQRLTKPNLCVLYQSSVTSSSFEEVCRVGAGTFDGMILEWSERNEGPFVEIANRHGIELVQCIGPWHSEERIVEILRLARPQGLIYLMSAPMTGAELFTTAALTDCVALIKKHRGDVVVAAGFGVKSAADVRALQQVVGLDAVIIGTELLRRLGMGVDEAKRFLLEVERALVIT